MRTLSNYRAWVGLLVVLGTTGSAQAFYWKGWPGSRVAPDQTLLPRPDVRQPERLPGPGDTPFTPPELDTPPLPPDDFLPPPGTPPEHVPEPGSGIVAVVGLGVVAVRRWVRKAE